MWALVGVRLFITSFSRQHLVLCDPNYVGYLYVSTLAYLGPLTSTYTASGTEWYTFSISTFWCNARRSGRLHYTLILHFAFNAAILCLSLSCLESFRIVLLPRDEPNRIEVVVYPEFDLVRAWSSELAENKTWIITPHPTSFPSFNIDATVSSKHPDRLLVKYYPDCILL